MKQKHLIWLGAFLAGAILAAYLAGVFDDDVSTVQVPEVNVDPADLTAFSIRSSETEIGLEKSDEGWMLSDPIGGKADSTVVARFLEDLEALELTNVVSRSPERYAQFGVDSAGTTLTLTSGDSRRTLIIGDRSSDYASSYVRMEGDERVFLSRKAVDIPEELDRWRDRTIIDVSVGDVSSVTVEGPGRAYSISKSGARWMVDGEPADSSAVQRWLARFDPMLSDGFYDAMETSADSALTVTLHTNDGERETLTFVPRETDYAAQAAGTATAYRVRAMRIDQFVPERSYFSSE